MLSPSWIDGPPTGEGIWLVELVTKDFEVFVIEKTRTVEGDRTYLAAVWDGDSEPLDDPESQVQLAKRSYGPVPLN